MFSLLTEKWLPVRRKDGSRDWIAPHQIVEPDIVALAANRPDFNGALMQFLIGLLQTTTPVNTEKEWRQSFNTPPDTNAVMQWFSSVAEAFVLDGDGARFMQDFSLEVPKKDLSAIDSLLIDAAGESTKLKNTDHFVKRNTVNALCPCCVAAALFTLHLNAPAGGAGNRTSLRGGGPLTTLVIATPSRSLWHDLWLNVMPKSVFLRQQGGDGQKTAPHFTFPWLADIGCIQTQGGETQPVQVHPHHVFWAMPRRIRLDFSDVKAGQCDICKRPSITLVANYVTKPQGLNYKGAWRHPFSPYYESKEGWLPEHPQPSGFSYENWLAWVLGSATNKKKVESASIIKYALDDKERQTGHSRLWVFGYDMDNMKPRCWYETTFPLYNLLEVDHSTQENVQHLVKSWIEAAEQVTFYLRQAIKYAWFGDGDMRGDLSFADKAFWDATEADFYRQLRDLLAQAQSIGIDMDDAVFITGIGEKWHKVLLKQAIDLFDKDIVGAGAIDQQNPQRIAKAYNGLRMNLYGKALKTILRLPVADKKDKPSKPDKVGKTNPSIPKPSIQLS